MKCRLPALGWTLSDSGTSRFVVYAALGHLAAVAEGKVKNFELLLFQSGERFVPCMLSIFDVDPRACLKSSLLIRCTHEGALKGGDGGAVCLGKRRRAKSHSKKPEVPWRGHGGLLNKIRPTAENYSFRR